jgi:5-(carboxyamino)imidazole ribonucleotide synthase
MDTPILPGATIGVFGSGQLGRMLALSARTAGYRLHTFSPEPDSPCGQVADREVVAPYSDLAAVRSFVQSVDVMTFEFENVDAAVGAIAAELGKPVRPGGHVLHTTQNRLREKQFLTQHGIPTVPYAAVRSLADLEEAIAIVGLPAVIKTAAFGYDGKGQIVVTSPSAAPAAWQSIGGVDAVLEAFVSLEMELSVVAARSANGDFAHYGAIENIHRNHILDLSIAPARLSPALAHHAIDITESIFHALDIVGVLCVEFFLTETGQLLVNELAPRPHNSGHLTIEAAPSSQFEQQWRAICGLPLGATQLRTPAVMANVLGDLWQGGEPNWSAALSLPNIKLHLYGKASARPGRKMGHITAWAADLPEALLAAQTARRLLRPELESDMDIHTQL